MDALTHISINMKRVSLLHIILIVSIVSIVSGCLGDKGNTLDSYDVGTVTEINGQQCLKLDNINIYISGSGMPQYTSDPVTRCFCTFHIDWDNQPENASASGIYSATINTESVWNVENFLQTAANPFPGSDSLVNISQPYITNLTSSQIITFQTSSYVSDNATFQLAVEAKDDANNTMTLNLVYDGGNEDNSATVNRWHSFTLPTVDNSYNLNIRFKSRTTPSFSAMKYTDAEAPENNMYVFTTTLTPLSSDTES